ncbi:MAG: hypothetical protein WD200_00750 [Candidatus Andersenbacteria bacterium]
MTLKEIFRVTGIPVVIASLCCLTPVILVLFGLSTVAFAASLADVFYGQYKWAFRGVGLVLVLFSFIFYLRRSKGICTIDEAKKRRQEIINLAFITLSAAVIGYVVFLYVVVELLGIWLKIW